MDFYQENNLTFQYVIEPQTHPENVSFYPLNVDQQSYHELKPRVFDYNSTTQYYLQDGSTYFTNIPTQVEDTKIHFVRPLEEKLRRKRTRFTTDQLLSLEEAFSENPYIPKLKRMELGKLLNLPDVQVKIWFANRRVKNKRDKKKIQKKVNHKKIFLNENNNNLGEIETCRNITVSEFSYLNDIPNVLDDKFLRGEN